MHSPLVEVRRRQRGRLVRVALLLLLFALAAGTGSYAALYVLQAPDVPDVRSLADHKPSIITRVYADTGDQVADFAEERRVVVGYAQIPPSLRNAIVAVEDADFFQHHGISLRGILRAAYENFRAGHVVGGGSSLTQQLAKLMFLSPEQTLRRKIKEAILAFHLERTYSKEEILQFYCNQVYLGHNRYGMEAGARFFFNTSLGDLTVEQAALLAGLPQRPNGLSPYRYPVAALARRNHVLDRMADEGFLDAAEAARLKLKPLGVVELRSDEAATAPFFVEEVRQELEKQFGERRLYHDGLKVYTTLNPRLQAAAERAVRSGLLALDERQGWRGTSLNVLSSDPATDLESWTDPSWREPFRPGDLVHGLVLSTRGSRVQVRVGSLKAELGEVPAWIGRRRPSDLYRVGDVGLFRIVSVDPGQGRLELEISQEPQAEASLVAIEIRTGKVLALVGGWSFERSKFNRAVQAWRQTGSAFKPILYSAAIANGFTPADSLMDEPIAITDPWSRTTYSPENYSRRYYGLTTLREALEKSRNPVSVQLLQRVGAHTVIDFARRLGLTGKLDPYPSLALGAFEDTLLEVTSAFAVLADLGVYRAPYFIERVEDREGAVLTARNPIPRQAIPPDVAYVTTYMLRGVIQSGTAARARRLGRTLAGKTGTTDDFTDAWFLGYTPSLICGVWVGFDQKRSLGRGEVGAKAALPIWIDFMAEALEGTPDEDFVRPPGVEFVAIDKETGLRASDHCAASFPEAFLRGTAPTAYCTPRDHEIRALPYSLQKVYLAGGTPDLTDQTPGMGPHELEDAPD